MHIFFKIFQILITLELFFGNCSQLLRADDSPIFVVGPIYSINPDGTCTETQDGKLGDLANKNIHWNSKTKSIQIFAAKNEEVAVQIVIPKEGSGYTAQAEELKGPGVIPADRATFSMVAWAKGVGGALIADLIIPLDGTISGIKTVEIPLVVKGLPEAQNKVGVILYELWVPKKAAAGIYLGKIKVLKSGEVIETLNVNLTILDLELPDRPSYALELLCYSSPIKASLFADAPSIAKTTKVTPEIKAYIHQVYKLSMDNRCFLNILPYSGSRGSPVFAYPVENTGANGKIPSYEEYDDLFAAVLDGKLNKFGKAPMHFTLPFNVNYPYSGNGEPANQFNWQPFANKMPATQGVLPELKEYEDINKTIAAQTFKHFAEKGWKDTCFEFFHNQKGDPKKNRIGSWKLDEPVTKSDYEALRYLFNLGRWSAEASKALGIKTANRIDIGHWHCDQTFDINGNLLKCYKAKAYDTANAQEILGPSVDHWIIGINHLESANRLVKNYEKSGTKMMTYSTSGNMRINNCGIRSEGFRGARRGTVGNIIYKLTPQDPNGLVDKEDAYVLYNGNTIGFNGGICSKRIKLWRDAVNDFEFIKLAKAKNADETNAIINKMTFIGPVGDDYKNSASFCPNNNPEDYSSARILLYNIALGKKTEGFTIQGRSKQYSIASSADRITGYD